jgi:cellulose synthase/poly-beta-1,6-N-acetylglucosamine synthase-like glycosyltransferase
VWLLHLDEDSLVTNQCINSILSYINNPNSNPVANGPILYKKEKSITTFFAECHRHWNFYWLVSQTKTGRVHWLNGSNLLIRSDIEHEIGWNYGNYISEDSRFGYETKKKLGNVFGWHGGLMIESPPKTIKDLIKQRSRWFFGSILNIPYVPKSILVRRVYSISCWFLGFFLSTMFFASIIGLIPNINGWILILFAINALLWLSRYQLGLFRNMYRIKIPKFKKILFHIILLVLTPILEIICTVPTIYALIKRPKEFDITGK